MFQDAAAAILCNKFSVIFDFIQRILNMLYIVSISNNQMFENITYMGLNLEEKKVSC